MEKEKDRRAKLAKILIRVDGSNAIGFGHLRRCLNIAQWLRGKFEVTFCTKRTKEAVEVLKKSGFQTTFLEPEITRQQEITEILDLVEQWTPKVVINDILNTAEDYMTPLSEMKVRTVNFDDKGPGAASADVVVDANRRENRKKYFGPKYVVLHPEYAKETKKVRALHKSVRHVVVSIGGGDPNQYTDKLLECLEKAERKFSCTVVLGPTFAGAKELKKKWKDHGWIHFLEKIDNLIKPFLWADLAIVNGGLTMFEAICLGTPTLVVSQNANEIKNVKRLERKHVVVDAGLGSKLSATKLNKRLKKVCDDAAYRQKLSLAGKEMVDGIGIFRAIGIIERLARKR